MTMEHIDLAELRDALKAAGLDGWLLYDFKGANPIARRVTGFGGLGLYRLINSVSRSELRSFIHDTLGPVLDLPEPTRGDMLKTLAVFFDTRYNIAESARRLHFHYNTMRYRVSKLERMLGEFADDAQAGLRIGVALQVMRMYEISGDAAETLT